jgi:F-type H+-transporting ATPase subunit b
MHIDWFVFFAQVVNFLILIYLLKRFLYGRILQAMDEREAKIGKTFEEAERLKKEAEQSAQAFESKNKAIQDRHDELLNQAVKEAEEYKRELMSQARAEVDQIRKRWQDSVDREKTSFLHHLRQRAGRQVYEVTRRILQDMVDENVEQRMVSVFIKRVETLPDQDAEAFRSSILKSERGVVLQSAFDIDPANRGKIHEAMNRCRFDTAKLRYEVADNLVAGIEMRTDGHKLAWSFDDYLESLEESFTHVLQEEAGERA